MIVFPRGEVKTWSDLTPGALFGVSISGETHLGVKIQGSGDEFHCAVLTGLPPHCVREIVVQNSLLYFFPNSKIVPVGRRLQFSAEPAATAGLAPLNGAGSAPPENFLLRAMNFVSVATLSSNGGLQLARPTQMTTEINRYRGYDIVPDRQWSQWCVSVYATRSDLPLFSRPILRQIRGSARGAFGISIAWRRWPGMKRREPW